MRTETIVLRIEDGTQMNAYVAMPTAPGNYPAVMVFQEAFGVNHYIKDIAHRLVAEGYIAIAPELFHRTADPGFDMPYTEFPKVMPHLQALTTEGMIADCSASYNWLRLQPEVLANKIACIGFCMGGRVSFLANTAMKLSGAISFYGGGMHMLAERATESGSPLLLFWGGKDHHIKPEHIKTVTDALTAAGKNFVNVVFSEADHGFFCNERSAYHAESSHEAWGMVREFLKTKLDVR
jgi:carboxymethylenebutenolidase